MQNAWLGIPYYQQFVEFPRHIINDAVHLKFAEKYAAKLITFDNDFKKFQGHTDFEIEIL